MGFMDKAKKLAEQAQSRLDEVQQQFNESQGTSQGGDGPVTEYDKHGRPVTPAPAAEAAAPPPSPAPAPPAPPAPPAAAAPDEYAPPPLTPGDPLKG
jgi:hypothetical protein